MPEIIAGGHVYLAKPPLYLLKQGTKKHYAYNDEDKEAILDRLIAERVAKGVKVDEAGDRNKQAGLTAPVQRYKGLGEMDAEQLWDTTMNPENRVLQQVRVEDAEKTDAIFTKLMGDQVDLRKAFIQSRAKSLSLEDLDI
jgi:DNA gyrase subunit B